MASETKWTPGPWTADPTCYSMHTNPFPDMMDFATSIECNAPFTENEFADEPFSQEETQNCARVFGRNKDEMAANANLIAAAPDLYEALDAMVRAFESNLPDYDEDEDPSIATHLARAALRKARGEG